MSEKLQKFMQERKLINKEGTTQAHRNRLKQFMKKRLTTVMVAAIDEFEKAFGENWGHGLTNDEKTDAQLDLSPMWNICREEIFNRGNIQIRAMEKELDSYELELIRYESQFNAQPPRG